MRTTTSKDKFLQRAVGVALTSQCKFKHGAIVVRHGRVLAAAPNTYRNDPRYMDKDWKVNCSTHAEIAAMKKAGWPKRVSLFVARVNREGQPRLSKPCANCAAVLEAHKVQVYWTE